MAKYAITTIDNPYNPFNDFTSWLLFDSQKGYNTCSYLDRVSEVEDDMTDEEKEAAVEKGIDDIIDNDFLNLYRKVKKSDYEKGIDILETPDGKPEMVEST